MLEKKRTNKYEDTKKPKLIGWRQNSAQGKFLAINANTHKKTQIYKLNLHLK